MRDEKINYYFNDKLVGRNTFYNYLKNHSLSKVRSYKFGAFGIVDFYDFDKKKYNKYLKKLNGYNGYAPISLIFNYIEKKTGEIVDTGKFKIEKVKIQQSKSNW